MGKANSTRRRSDFIDMTGQQRGEWTVLEFHHTKNRMAYWLCRCVCGVVKPVRGPALRNGGSRSCPSCAAKRHGMETTPEYKTWSSMWQRCRNPNAANYALYGGRGITVCQRWLIFENFFDDMGPKPSPKHSIDRIDNEGNYEPDNCRWATPKEQSRNSRRNRLLTYNGKTMCVAEWADKIGISRHALYARLNKDWSTEKTLTTPFIPCNKRRWQ